MLTVQDIKNKRIKGAWKGRLFNESKVKFEGVATAIIIKVDKPSIKKKN